MNLRLVLVCLVAGLGIGIPSRPDIEGWIAFPLERTQARAAVVDANDGARETAREFRRFGTDGPRVARSWRRAPAILQTRPVVRTTEPEAPAPPALPAPSQTPAALAATPSQPATPPSFEPIEVDERMYSGLAYDLTYFGEGLGMLRRVAAPSKPTPSPVRLDELMELAIARHGADAVRLVGRLGRDLNAFAAGELARESFMAMEENPDLYFDGALEAPETAEPIAAAPSPFEAMERSDALYFAENLEVETPEPAAPAAAAEVTVASELPPIPADPFAPAETIEEPTAAVAVNAEPEPAGRGEVSRAVRLTGQALSAWVNVLTNPPLVASSAGSASIR